jgi:hypothetical protein
MPWAVLADQETRDTNAVVEMISTQTARITAIVGGALLDEHIRRTLAERLRKGNTAGWLLSVPLINLEPKIALLYLLNAFDKATFNALKGIVGVRNFYAHDLSASQSFETETNKEFLEHIGFLTLHEGRSHYPDHRYGGDSRFAIEPVTDRRSQFLVNLKLGLIALMRDRCSHEPYSNKGLTDDEIKKKFDG